MRAHLSTIRHLLKTASVGCPTGLVALAGRVHVHLIKKQTAKKKVYLYPKLGITDLREMYYAFFYIKVWEILLFLKNLLLLCEL